MTDLVLVQDGADNPRDSFVEGLGDPEDVWGDFLGVFPVPVLVEELGWLDGLENFKLDAGELFGYFLGVVVKEFGVLLGGILDLGRVNVLNNLPH